YHLYTQSSRNHKDLHSFPTRRSSDLTRMAILQKKIGEENINIPTEALTYIANQIQSNIRELEGALNRVLAFSKLQGQPITTELTAAALKDIIQAPKSKKITIQDIQKVVGEYYSVRIEDFSAKKRTKSIHIHVRLQCIYHVN